MDSGHTIVQLHSGISPDAPNRLVRDVGKPSPPTVRSPECRPQSSGDGRIVSRLEQVAEHLPLPTSKTLVESSTQTEIIQRDCGTGCSPMAEEQLVPVSHGTPPTTGTSSRTDTHPDGTSEACLRFIMDDGKASFDDFLVLAMGRRMGISEDNVRFSEQYKALSTQRQYGSWWNKWIAYVRLHKPDVVSLDFCISFLRSLHEGGLASTTINSLKSGISVPIKYAFNVDLSDEVFLKVVKACAKLNPKLPAQPPEWSLEKVLQKAASINPNCDDLILHTRKTAFLLTLASGGRISEIVALKRGEDHIQILPSGGARLTPDRNFLAKHESPTDRWKPWLITPLPEFPPLCPVLALKRYLYLTKHIKEGQLFRGETNDCTLSPKQLGNKIIAFICSAEPDKKAKVHQLRGIGASLNFYEYMNFEDLKIYTGWKSARVFYKHYLKDVQNLSLPVVAAGKVVHPR